MTQHKTASDLWQDYAFLTREIVKFVAKQEYDLVLALFDQREKLQVKIQALPDNDFSQTESGQKLLQSVQGQNKVIADGLQRLYNNAKRGRQISNAYDQNAGYVAGSFMDKQS